jgi:hydroxymethylbilane synthase
VSSGTLPAHLRIGTRGSKLAVAQTGIVAAALGEAGFEPEVVTVKTEDDAVGDKARFVRAIEQALLAEEIDLAVHSAKDLPGDATPGLEIAAIPPREDARDAYIGEVTEVEAIPEGATVGTASLRRRSQLLAERPDITVTELRGNVDTRLRRLDEGEATGIILAAAGLKRLGLEGEVDWHEFQVDRMIPAPGQGALALQMRAGDPRVHRVRGAVEKEEDSRIEVFCEFAAVGALGADCDTPVGVHAYRNGSALHVDAYCGLPDGSEWIRDSVEGSPVDPRQLGLLLASQMEAAGALDLLARAKQAAPS